MMNPFDDEDLPRPLPLDDPDLLRVVDQAMEPFKKTLSKKMQEALRKETLLQLSTNPTAVALIRSIKRPKVAVSDEILVHTPTEEEPMKSSGSGQRGKP